MHLPLHAILRPFTFSPQSSFQEASIPAAQGCLWSLRVLRGQDIFLTSKDHVGVHVYVPARVCELRDTWEHRGSHYTGTPAVASRKVLGCGGQCHKSTGSELDPSLSGPPSFTWQ